MENKNYYPLRVSRNQRMIISGVRASGCPFDEKENGWVLCSFEPLKIAAMLVEAYNEKYGPKPEPEFTPEQVSQMMAKQPVRFMKTDEDMASSFEKYIDNVSDEKLDKIINEINGPVITDADLISTALQEGSITVAQAIQLHEVVETPGFKNLFIQMQYEHNGRKLAYKFNQELLDRKFSSMDFICSELQQSQVLFHAFLKSDPFYKIKDVAELMITAIQNQHKILSCGNGGSYSDAQHFASELSGKYRGVRPAIAAIALSDGGAMSCIANDFGYAHVFERQVEAIGKSGDVLLCLSTSGNSENVILAAKRAKEIGITTVGICGNSGGELKKHLDIMIEVPHSGTADRIQELSIIVIHILVGLIEKGIA